MDDLLLSPNWLAESVRVTFFSAVAKPVSPIWQAVIGSPPQEVNERPAELFRAEVGPFGAGTLIAHQQGGIRTDFIYGVKPEPFPDPVRANPDDNLAHIGPLTSAIQLFTKLLQDQATELFERSNRIAFAPTAVRQGIDTDAVMAFIAELVSLPIELGDSDVHFQINRPLKATSYEGLINRVAKWQTIRTQVFAVNPLGGFQAPPGLMPMKFVNYARFEVDINTSKIDPAPFDDVSTVWDELLSVTNDFLSTRFGHV